MSGKYRPVSTAEKRAMLEAAGEEWPIGSDGLPKTWSPRTAIPAGGTWRKRSVRRARQREKRAIRISLGICERCGDLRAATQTTYCEKCRNSEVLRNRRRYLVRNSDPVNRKKQCIYQLYYRHNRKKASYVQQGLIDQRLSLGDNGQKDGSSRSGVVA